MRAFRPLSRSWSSSTGCLSRASVLPRPALVTSLVRQPEHFRSQTSFQTVTRSPFTLRRLQSTSATVASPSESPSASSPESKQPDPNEPAYQITFRCRPCQTVSTHRMTKQAYHYGAVLIQCPGCKNRHVMADHLGIFTEKGQGGTLEDILARYGQGEVKNSTVRKGFQDGDLEFWDDGTVYNKKEQQREDERDGKIEQRPDKKSVDLGNNE